MTVNIWDNSSDEKAQLNKCDLSARLKAGYIYAAGKIHISEATKAALDSIVDTEFETELRGEIEVKVRRGFNFELRIESAFCNFLSAVIRNKLGGGRRFDYSFPLLDARAQRKNILQH